MKAALNGLKAMKPRSGLTSPELLEKAIKVVEAKLARG
jgi:hypothetical protein